MKYIIDMDALVRCLHHINTEGKIGGKPVVKLESVISFMREFPHEKIEDSEEPLKAKESSSPIEFIRIEDECLYSLKQCYELIRKQSSDKPYYLWYENKLDGTIMYDEVIFVEPVRGHEDLSSYQITSLKEFMRFYEEVWL